MDGRQRLLKPVCLFRCPAMDLIGMEQSKEDAAELGYGGLERTIGKYCMSIMWQRACGPGVPAVLHCLWKG